MIPVLADSRPDLHPHLRLHRPRHHTHYSQGSVKTPTRTISTAKNTPVQSQYSGSCLSELSFSRPNFWLKNALLYSSVADL